MERTLRRRGILLLSNLKKNDYQVITMLTSAGCIVVKQSRSTQRGCKFGFFGELLEAQNSSQVLVPTRCIYVHLEGWSSFKRTGEETRIPLCMRSRRSYGLDRVDHSRPNCFAFVDQSDCEISRAS